jgi:hypothetical protein
MYLPYYRFEELNAVVITSTATTLSLCMLLSLFHAKNEVSCLEIPAFGGGWGDAFGT